MAHPCLRSTRLSLIDKLNSADAWHDYLRYKAERGNLTPAQLEDLKQFVEDREYEGVALRVQSGQPFAVPAKKLVGKANSTKKRVLYVFPREENYLLKLLTFLAIREYDHVFSPNLYSFRAHTDSKRAIMSLVKLPNISQMYSYKVDVSDYFGSVDIDLLLPKLKAVLASDPAFYDFLERLLTDDRALVGDQVAHESKGIMAGSAISTFLANVYLSDLDHAFDELPYPYARYSDDIIAFAPTPEEVQRCETMIKTALDTQNLGVNPAKEMRTAPHEQWTFLGICYQDGIVDIAPISAQKLKDKMRRKSRSLLRWRARNGHQYEHAAKAFVRSLNRKLYEGTKSSDLTWARWFFPLINTDKTLHEIDAYMQDCLRYVATGKRTKARFNFRYEDMKRLGYRSLVNEYYKGRES